MRILERNPVPSAPSLSMTAMIDVVFLLLIFFLMTFKITAQEGDFRMTPPVRSEHGGATEQTLSPTVHVRLLAAKDGALAKLRVGGRDLAGFDELTVLLQKMRTSKLAPDGGEIDVVLDCDYALSYEYVIQAMTAVAKAEDSIEPQVRFAPPRTL